MFRDLAAFVAWLLGHAAPPTDQKWRRVKAIERELLADNWLIYCAQDNIMNFQSWWHLARFHEDVVKRFAVSNPGERIPLKDETGRILEAMLRREGTQVFAEPAPPTDYEQADGSRIHMEGGSRLVRRPK